TRAVRRLLRLLDDRLLRGARGAYDLVGGLVGLDEPPLRRGGVRLGRAFAGLRRSRRLERNRLAGGVLTLVVVGHIKSLLSTTSIGSGQSPRTPEGAHRSRETFPLPAVLGPERQALRDGTLGQVPHVCLV